MADISKVKLPSGSVYDIKDEYARTQITTIHNELTGAMHYIGESTTAITDGGHESPITIPDAHIVYYVGTAPTGSALPSGYTAVKLQSGDVAIYDDPNDGANKGNKEYVALVTIGSGNVEQVTWSEFGSTGSLKALAFKDSATGSTSFTPQGDVSKPTFTGTTATINSSYTPSGTIAVTTAQTSSGSNYTPSGSVSQPSFTGNQMTSTGTYTPQGSISLSTTNKTATVSAASSGTKTYTPAGTVSTPSVTLKTPGAVTSINEPTPETVVTSLEVDPNPISGTPSDEINFCSVSNETLFIHPIKFNTGDSVSLTPVDVKTGDGEYEASQPTFTGTGARLVTGNIAVPNSASFTGEQDTISVTGTPDGTVSQPTFTGDDTKITATFNGTQDTATASYKPAGTISKPTFTGTSDTISVTVS